MKHEWNIWVVGGDQRQAQLAVQLARDGHTGSYLCPGAGGELGRAWSRNGICGGSRAGGLRDPSLPVTGEGRCPTPRCQRGAFPGRSAGPPAPGPDRLRRAGHAAGGRAGRCPGTDPARLFARKSFAIANAGAYGRGAIQIAMEELPITSTARVLVVGYGRLGRALAPGWPALGLSERGRPEVSDLALDRGGGLGGTPAGSCGLAVRLRSDPQYRAGPAPEEETLRIWKPGCLVLTWPPSQGAGG